MKWINHHRPYFSKDGYLPPGTVFELPDGEAPPHLSVDENGKPFINPNLAQTFPNTPVAGKGAGFEPVTMADVGMGKKQKASDR